MTARTSASDTSSATARRRGRPPKAAGDAAQVIRRAALHLFARHGFQGASIVEIAQLAGVAKPLVHYHFASKEGLWQAAVGEAFAALQVELMAFAAPSADVVPGQGLRQSARQLVAHAARHPEIVRIVVDETGKGSERATWLMQQYLLPLYALASHAYARLGKRGALHPDAPAIENLIPAVLGVMNFAFLEADVVKQAFRQDVFSSDYIERQGDLLYRLLASAFVVPGGNP